MEGGRNDSFKFNSVGAGFEMIPNIIKSRYMNIAPYLIQSETFTQLQSPTLKAYL